MYTLTMKQDELWLEQGHTPGQHCKNCGISYDVWEVITGCAALDCEDISFIGSDLNKEGY